MMGRGLKRKLLEGTEGTYELQRQSVLDISLDKYQRGQQLLEPSLRRSVLISNTMRQIQAEIRLEGTPLDESVCLPRPHAPVCLPALRRPIDPEDAGDDWMALSSEEDFSLSSAVSSILKDLEVVLDSSPVARVPLGSMENLPGGSGSWRVDRCAEGCRPPEALVFGSLEVMRSSYLRDVALDDLFPDIDTSVFERDAALQGPRTLSVAAGDELLKHLPMLSSSPSSSLFSSFSISQNIKELNELEHIMEILVKS